MHTTSYILTREDYLTGVRLGGSMPLLFRIPRYLFVLAFSLVFLYSLYLWLLISQEYVVLLIMNLLILLVMALYRPVFQRWQINKYYDSLVDAGKETVLELNEDGFAIQSGSSSTARNWGELKGWKEGPALILLYVSDRTYHILPKRALGDLPDGENVIREWIERSGIPYQSRPPGTILSAVLYLIFTAFLMLAFLT